MANVDKILDKKIDIDILIGKLMEELGDYKDTGDSIRFEYCPICAISHPNNPAFVVNQVDGTYYCHDCKQGGHISQLFGSKIIVSPINKKQICKAEEQHNLVVSTYYNNLSTAKKDSITYRYLLKRGIYYSTWQNLDLSLKESLSTSNSEVAVYPFIDNNSRIVAIQRLFINLDTLEKINRRYKGSKSKGVAILKDLPEVIVAEGLETGLSVLQHLGNSYGLIICGDTGNLASLATDENSWAISKRKKIIIAADNDINNTGIEAARKVFNKFHNKTLIFMPSRPGFDWNDILLCKKMQEEWI